MPPNGVSAWGRLFQVVYLGFFGLVVGGLLTLVIAVRVGALLMLAGVAGMFVSQLVYIAFAYRQTMRRPWPKVRPLEDDDDDW